MGESERALQSIFTIEEVVPADDAGGDGIYHVRYNHHSAFRTWEDPVTFHSRQQAQAAIDNEVRKVLEAMKPKPAVAECRYCGKYDAKHLPNAQVRPKAPHWFVTGCPVQDDTCHLCGRDAMARPDHVGELQYLFLTGEWFRFCFNHGPKAKVET